MRDRLTQAAPWVRKRRAPPVSAITSSLATLVRRLRGRGRPRRVIYTCLFAFSEHINDFAYQRDDWPVLKGGVRVLRDFDDARYLALNPDVNFDARRHWLYYGARERRR